MQTRKQTELTKKERLIRIMSRSTVLKQDVCNMLKCDEREARRAIEVVRKEHPVIAFSSKAGYRIATDITHIEDAKHTLNELNARIRKLTENKVALENFLTSCKG